MWMSGYAGRTAPAQEAETELWAKASVLENAHGIRAVLVTLDLVGIDRQMSQEICNRITSLHKIPREAIVLSVSHTHCGPVVGSTLSTMYALDATQQSRVASYSRKLIDRIEQAVTQAAQRVEPVTLAWGVGSAGFAVNRRANIEAEVPAKRAAGIALAGPVNHDVPVLTARREDGSLCGIIFGYACHATTLSYQKWCGDYPGFASSDLESTHPGSVAMFFAGCGADQNPLPRKTVELAKEYGLQLADAVERVIDLPMITLAPEFQAIYHEIDLAFVKVPSREECEFDMKSQDRFLASRARGFLADLDGGKSIPATYPYPIGIWRLGKSLEIVSLGGEVVVDYSRTIQEAISDRRAPQRSSQTENIADGSILGSDVWVMGYANDVMAYIPSLRVLNEGGYEGASAMVYYGRPSPWAADVEERILTEVVRQSDHLKIQSPQLLKQ